MELTETDKTLLKVCCNQRITYIHNVKGWNYAERAVAKAAVMGLYKRLTGEDL